MACKEHLAAVADAEGDCLLDREGRIAEICVAWVAELFHLRDAPKPWWMIACDAMMGPDAFAPVRWFRERLAVMKAPLE